MRQQASVTSVTMFFVLLESCATVSKPSPATTDNARESSAIRVADCDSPARSLPAEFQSMLVPRRRPVDSDDHWADLARQVPGGFAGILYDRSGRPTIMLTRPEQEQAVKTALAADRTFRHFDIMGARVVKARWDFAQLVDWFDYILLDSSIWQTTGMTMADKNEETNRIDLGVETESGRRQLIAKLAALGIPCDLVQVRIAGRVTPL